MGHADDQGRPGPQITDGSRNVLVGVLDSGIDADHPDLVANLDVANSVNCTDAGRPDLRRPAGSRRRATTARTSPAPSPPPATASASSASRPNVRMASVKVVNDDGFIYPEYAVCGFVEAGLQAHGRHEQQLLRRPVRVLLRGPARPVRRQGGRAPRRALVDQAGRRARRRRRQLRDRPVQQDAPTRQPRRRHARHAHHQQRLRGHPDRARRRRDRVVAAALPGGHAPQPAVGFSNRGLGVIDVAAPGSAILSTIVTNNGYGTRAAPRWRRRTSPACSP